MKISVTMRRYATQNVTLKDGLFIPKGTMLGISSHWHWDSSIHPDADVFDGYRYVKMAQDPAKEKFSHFVTTSPESLGFGHGKHACPGRFFASNEIKIALVHLLLKYDWKLKEGSDPKIFTLGWMMTSDANATILVKRRREEMTL
jgi:cytochrome P450